ncbi:MAG: hypothetical protein Q8Q09_03455 [Deltaproteobacteria bacterium]|nr:hypothetical protein [Deltaproteobacteria bacterium]
MKSVHTQMTAMLLMFSAPAAAQSQYPRPARPPVDMVSPAPQPPVVVGPSVRPVPAPASACPTGDCIAHSIATQDTCLMFDRAATGDNRWAQGLSLEIDSAIFTEQNQHGWNVVSYRIQWSNGAWSPWLVSGVNDLDHKYNPTHNTMRRMWSYFADHPHQALACHRNEQ